MGLDLVESIGVAQDAEVLATFPPGGVKLEDDSPNGDPTLRLTAGRPLAAVCEAELAHDRAGYANWLPFLLVDDPSLNGPILFVRDLRDLNSEFLQLRPGRTAWLYRPAEITRIGSSDMEE